MSSVVKENILRFKITVAALRAFIARLYSNIPIHDIKLVKMLQGQKQFGRIEPTTHFVEPLLLLEVMEQFSSIHKPESSVRTVA